MSTFLTDRGIPKVIHYCWFGHGEKPPIVQHCIKSWKEKCPEWDIVEWNESNFDVNCCEYTKEAYSKGKWAFVSDVARLIILHENGGVYLDTDVELKTTIPEEWLKYSAFLFFEIETRINTGKGFGCKQGNDCIKYMIDDYSGRKFIKENGKFDLRACTYYNTNALERYFESLDLSDRFQVIDGNAFISTGMYNKIAIHHYASSWTDDPKQNIETNKKWKDSGIKRFLRNPKRQKWIKQHTSEQIEKIYTFIAYDLMENCLIYYVKRWCKKYIINKLNRS